MKVRPFLVLAVLALGISACGQDDAERAPQATARSAGSATEAVPSVADLLADPERLRALIDSCRNDPGALGRTPACINAAEARKQRTADEMKRAVQ
jgi:hypothetical protein